MAGLARRELRPDCKAISHMYPYADKERTKLLAASMVIMFLWDGMTLCFLMLGAQSDFHYRTNPERRQTRLGVSSQSLSGTALTL